MLMSSGDLETGVYCEHESHWTSIEMADKGATVGAEWNLME